jgi:hypothetical protein
VEPLDQPPEIEERDDSEAGGGQPATPTSEDELEDADDLEEEDVEDEDEDGAHL